MDNKIELVKDMQKSYLDYAMSVIVGRALPDVRDGLKPVQRRILFDMNELGFTYDKPYKKCARTVGDVLGKYHPHGDSSVYDALCRMAQDFVMRYPLVDGHGNFGSDDGDSPASMRYTESRLMKTSNLMLKDINKETVDFVPNFDGEEKEPNVLPSRIPNLLVNGSNGIAVGVATNIPPHNLKDTINNVIYQIDNPNCDINELVDIIKAPDFPTKASIINPKEVKQIYSEGKGKIIMRGKYHIENIEKKKVIVFTEIPYNVDRSALKDKIYDLIHGYTKKVKEGKKTKEVFIPSKIPQIAEMKDDSDVRLGLRLMFVLKNNTDENIVLSLLFKHSDLQCNFSANFTAVKGNVLYEKLSLKDINYHYIEHQKDVLTRRCKYELTKAEKRIHILEGLKIAINNINKVIEIVKSSKNKTDSKNNLMKELSLTEIQSNAVIELKIYRLSGFEIKDIDSEYDELQSTVFSLIKILNNENELLNLLKTELVEIRDKYGDERKTKIIYEDTLQEISSDELIEDYNCNIILSSEGYVKKHLKQSDNHKLKDNDNIVQYITSTNKSDILLFSNHCNRYKIPCYELETYTPSQYGDYIPNIIKLEDNEKIIAMASVEKPTGHMICVYNDGKISKIDINSYLSNNKKLANCYSNKSKLMAIKYIKNDVNILLVSSEGKALIVNTDKINSKSSRNSQGNVGMKLDNNIIVGCIIDVNEDVNFELGTEKDKVKEFMLSDIAPSGRNNEERTIFNYILGRCGNQGNFLINTRTTNDKVINFKQL